MNRAKLLKDLIQVLMSMPDTDESEAPAGLPAQDSPLGELSEKPEGMDLAALKKDEDEELK